MEASSSRRHVKGQPPSWDISFTLNDGYTAIVGLEERRVYDRIIESNVGVIATTGLEGEHLLFDKAWLYH